MQGNKKELILEVTQDIVNEIMEQWAVDKDHSVEFSNGLKYSIKVIDLWLKRQGMEKGLKEAIKESDTPLYDKFELFKALGKLKSFDEITENELYQLYITENFPDSVIASLFNVEKKYVTKKRYKFGIKLSINPVVANMIIGSHSK